MILVCEAQSGLKRWILKHEGVCVSFRNMQHVDADEAFVGVMNFIYCP